MRNYTKYDSWQLLRFLRKDDVAAFTELYNRYWQKLFAIAYNRLRETETAEDVVHDVFTGLWAGRRQIEVDAPENYLATATKYAVFAKIKKKEKERRNLAANGQAPVYEMPVETQLQNKRILEIIKTEVEKLPPRCRLIFQYSRNEGLPVKEIAEKMKISPKTVENQLTRAIKHLKLLTRFFAGLLLILFPA